MESRGQAVGNSDGARRWAGVATFDEGLDKGAFSEPCVALRPFRGQWKPEK
jgi:hypothetical protein